MPKDTQENMSYKECPHYSDGYCLNETDAFGMNHACIQRNDCPEVMNMYYKQRAKEQLERLKTMRKK